MELIGYKDSGVFLSHCEIFVLKYVASQWGVAVQEYKIIEKASIIGFHCDSIKQALLGLEQCHLLEKDEYSDKWKFITCK